MLLNTFLILLVAYVMLLILDILLAPNRIYASSWLQLVSYHVRNNLLWMITLTLTIYCGGQGNSTSVIGLLLTLALASYALCKMGLIPLDKS